MSLAPLASRVGDPQDDLHALCADRGEAGPEAGQQRRWQVGGLVLVEVQVAVDQGVAAGLGAGEGAVGLVGVETGDGVARVVVDGGVVDDLVSVVEAAFRVREDPERSAVQVAVVVGAAARAAPGVRVSEGEGERDREGPVRRFFNRPAPSTVDGAGATGQLVKEKWSMEMLPLPPNQKPMLSWPGLVRLMPLATRGILMSW